MIKCAIYGFRLYTVGCFWILEGFCSASSAVIWCFLIFFYVWEKIVVGIWDEWNNFFFHDFFVWIGKLEFKIKNTMNIKPVLIIYMGINVENIFQCVHVLISIIVSKLVYNISLHMKYKPHNCINDIWYSNLLVYIGNIII